MGISRDLQRSIIKFHTWNLGESWVEAETGTSAVPIYWWLTHPLNNTGVLLTGSCCIIGKGTWCAHTWEPMGDNAQRNNWWNTVKEMDKQTFDSLGLCFGLWNCVLAVVQVSGGVSMMDTASVGISRWHVFGHIYNHVVHGDAVIRTAVSLSKGMWFKFDCVRALEGKV
jgi:hypothetical protein